MSCVPPSLLRVLILEDRQSDAELAVRELERAGFALSWTRVDTEEEFLGRLDDPSDLVLADYDLPGYDGLRALEAVLTRRLDVPFVIVSGTLGEERAVEAIHRGADDYVLKDRLTRLGPAVAAALERRRLARQAREAQSALFESEERYRDLFENANDLIFTHDASGTFVSANRRALEITGYGPAELGSIGVLDVLTPESAARALALTARQVTGEVERAYIEVDLVTKDGRVVPLEVSSRVLRDPDGTAIGIQGIARDISERKAAAAALDESRARLQALFDNAQDAFMLADDEGRYVDVNAAACQLTGYSREELLRMTVRDVAPPGIPLEAVWRSFLEAGLMEGEFPIVRKDGDQVMSEYRAVANIAPGLHLSIIRDVTVRKAGEEALRRSEQRLRVALDAGRLGVWEWDMLSQRAVLDGQIEAIYGYEPGTFPATEAAFVELVHPEDRDRIADEIERSRAESGPMHFEFRIIRPDGSVRWVEVHGASLEEEALPRMSRVGVLADVTQSKEDEARLRETIEQLRRTDNQRRRLLSHVVSAQEAERARIAGDIHDDSVQVMTAVGLRLQALRRYLPPGEAADRLETLQQTVELATSRLRHLLFELRPRALDSDGIAAALQIYVEQSFADSPMECSLVSHLAVEPATDTRVIAFRICQEALTNARKHSRARAVRVRLEMDNGGLLVTISDDGVGFPSDVLERDRPGHLGLSAMRDRAESAGGWLCAGGASDGGARVTFWLPWELEGEAAS